VFHWVKLHETSGTIFELVGQDPDSSRMRSRQQEQLAQMRLLFRAKEAKVVMGMHPRAGHLEDRPGLEAGREGGSGHGKRDGSSVKLVSVNRANNVAIMLSKCKLPHEEIRDAIVTGNPRNVLSLDRLSLIQQVRCRPLPALITGLHGREVSLCTCKYRIVLRVGGLLLGSVSWNQLDDCYSVHHSWLLQCVLSSRRQESNL